jgi:hypothetical protein
MIRQFKSVFDTESGPALIIGNGPSLNKTPLELIDLAPSFACNYFPMHARQAAGSLDYLVMTDKGVIRNEKLWEHLWPLPVFVFARWLSEIPKGVDWNRPIYPWVNRDDLVPGFTSGDVWGQYFPTSGHVAAWIAIKMGFSPIYLVGMDCTVQVGSIEGVDDTGHSKLPHFYDDNPGRPSALWDIAWGNINLWAQQRGAEIINLSWVTEITQLPWKDYRDVWETYRGGRQRSWDDTGIWEPPRGAPAICNQPVAGVLEDSTEVLDSLGQSIPTRSAAPHRPKNQNILESQD